MRAIFVGVLPQLVQLPHAQAKSKFKRFGLLFARDLKAFTKTTLRLIQISARAQICFPKQTIYLSRVKAFRVLFIEPQLRLMQKIERLRVTFILYAYIRQ